MSFTLSSRNQVILYGASGMGIKTGEKLVGGGYIVKAFLDKNASVIKRVGGIPVYSIDTLPPGDTENTVIIILLQNTMQHDAIARSLYERGYRKIIFFPMRPGGGQVSRMRTVFNDCIRYEFGKLSDVPEYQEISGLNHVGGGILADDGKEIIFWAPAELCFSADKGGYKGIRSSDYTQEAEALLNMHIRGRNLFCLKPYWDLFAYLKGERTDCGLYLSIFGKEGHINRENYDDLRLLRDRNTLYNLFIQAVNKEPDFFVESPGEAEIQPSGRILMHDGIHRAVFLLMTEYRWLPVRVCREGYQTLKNAEVEEELFGWMERQKQDGLKYPIEHPSFFPFPVERYDLLQQWGRLSGRLCSENIRVESVWDFSLTNAYIARNFVRSGVKGVRCLTEKDDTLTSLENRLFRMNNIVCSADMSALIRGEGGRKLLVIDSRVLFENGEMLLKEDVLGQMKGVCVMNIPSDRTNEGALTDCTVFDGWENTVIYSMALNGVRCKTCLLLRKD